MSETRSTYARRLAAALAGLALAGWAMAAPAEASDLDRWKKKVSKVAPAPLSAYDNPKALCVCLDDANQNLVNGVGAIWHQAQSVGNTTYLRAGCLVMRFWSNGDRQGADLCEHWTPLPR